VRYMAPEQIVGSPLDRRADIFSAGMVLWELATGELPWKGTSEITIINRVINGELPPIRSVAPTVREDIEQICTKAVHFDREQRYATAAEMEAAIEQVLSTMTARVAPRDIGRVVAEHFDDVRVTTRRVIEAQLAKSDRREATAVVPVGQLLHVGSEPGPLPDAIAARRSRQVWASLSVVAAVGLCAALFALLGRHSHAEQLAASTPSLTKPEEPAPSTAESTSSPVPRAEMRVEPRVETRVEMRVEIRLQAIPPSGTIFFDAERLSTNPAVITRVADGSTHTVRAEARGYAGRTVQIVVDSGADLVLTLERAPSVPSPPMPAQRLSAGGSAASPPPPPPDCNPPYYIDEQGIKKFKPRCI